MIIYSEILGETFSSPHACLQAEKEYEDRLKAEEERLAREAAEEAEKAAIEDELIENYLTLLDACDDFIDSLAKVAGEDDINPAIKAMVLAEVILDAQSFSTEG